MMIDWDGGHVDWEWTRTNRLFLYSHGAAHAVSLFWDGLSGDFLGWYVDLCEPWRRTPIGFDSRDQILDIVVSPEFAVQWKDEEEFDWAIERGMFGLDEAAAIRQEAERVGLLIEKREPPFSDGWERWTPDPGWSIPLLPENWNERF